MIAVIVPKGWHGTSVAKLAHGGAIRCAMSLKKDISKPPVLRVGFVPLTDCAPLVMAKELGLFHKLGVRVSLQLEI